jgi:hypothetical protein
MEPGSGGSGSSWYAFPAHVSHTLSGSRVGAAGTFSPASQSMQNPLPDARGTLMASESRWYAMRPGNTAVDQTHMPHSSVPKELLDKAGTDESRRGGGELPPQCCASHMLARRTTRSHPWRGLCSFHRWESISKPVAPQLNDEDEFAWLQDPTEPTLKYLTEENRYSANVMQPSATLVTAVYSEIRGRVVEPESSVPERCGDYYYYSRPSTAGDGFPLHCRTHAGPGGQFPGNGANENVILDPNELCSVLDCE